MAGRRKGEAVKRRGPRVRADQARQRVQDRRFARAVRPDERDHFTRRHSKRRPAHGRDGAIADGEALHVENRPVRPGADRGEGPVLGPIRIYLESVRVRPHIQRGVDAGQEVDNRSRRNRSMIGSSNSERWFRRARDSSS
mgnify:CR=1 FL=1